MKKILVVEDNRALLMGLEAALRGAGFEADLAADITTAQGKLDACVDLVLLDLNLPDGEGFSFCRLIKAERDVPVIFLTVRDDECDIIKGLDIGADDYIIKPFKLGVLVSRINAVLRRAGQRPQEGDVLSCHDILLEKSRTKVCRGNVEIPLTPGEYKLLLALLEHKNQTLTRAALLERLWDMDGEFVNDNTLTSLMKRLREKVERDPQHPRIIKTVWGFGYRAEEEA